MNEACTTDVASASSGAHRSWSPHIREVNPLQPDPGAQFSCLSEVEIFADLSPAEIREMDRLAPARAFRSGELVFSQSQPVSALFILKKGRVRVFRVTEDGKTLTMAILSPGAVFGEMLLVGQRMYDNYAEAIERVEICQLDNTEVEKYLLGDVRVASRIARHLGEQVALLEERLTDLALRPLLARTAGTLVRLSAAERSSRFGNVAVRLTHDQLAGLLGATREATSKAMSDLAARGLIRQGRGRVLVLDREGLRVLSRLGT